MTYIWEEDASKLTKELRFFFTLLFSVILLFGVVGNLAAIWLALNRKHRLFYKCCVISLSTSDGLMAISTCAYSISMFSHPWINWTMGEFMCKFIPFIQIMTVLSNSFTLSSIAMDRYKGVVNATHSRWNPTLLSCVGVILILWSIAIVSAIPMFLEYYIKPIFVLSGNKHTNIITAYTIVDFCSVTSKKRMNIYMSTLFALIFLPLLITFLILYGMIGSFIWMRRPVTGRPVAAEGREMAISRGTDKDEEDLRAGGKELTTESTSATATTTLTTLSTSGTAHTSRPVHHHESTRAIQSEKRKKRILKIIFALMITFFITRLPIWCFNIASKNNNLEERKWWILQYILSALSLMGTVLNPFLYGFLQEGMPRNRMGNFVYFLCPLGRKRTRGPSSPQLRTVPVGNPFVKGNVTPEKKQGDKPWTIT